MSVSTVAAAPRVTESRSARAADATSATSRPNGTVGVGIGAVIGVTAGPLLGYMQLRATNSLPKTFVGNVATALALGIGGALMLGLIGGVVQETGQKLLWCTQPRN